MSNTSKLNNTVINNFKTVKYWFIIPPIGLLTLACIYFFYFINKGNYIETYPSLQKELFLSLNGTLSQLPNLQFNLTQFGDALISFSLISILVFYAPKFWEGLLTSSILSLIVSAGLKKLIAMPRPAAVFNQDSFTIIGRTLTGNNSLPSGHSMTTFIVLTVLLFAFMPKKNNLKIAWFILLILAGLIFAFSRVGVGAHYPIDVLIGSTIGFTLAIIGIKISNTINWFNWVKNIKAYPFFIVVFVIFIFLLIQKIFKTNLFIFYLAILSLIISLYKLITAYVKSAKKKN